MHAMHTYHITVQDSVNENDLNQMSPLKMTDVRVEKTTTQFTVYTDQSGLIGLLRHLHGRGFVLLSITYEQ